MPSPSTSVDPARPGRLKVWLQGGSDFEADPDHHVRVSLNGSFVAEASWDGKREQVIEADLGPGILQEGANTLSLENVGDTAAAYSMVFLNRFEVTAPTAAVAEAGTARGTLHRSRERPRSPGCRQARLVLDTDGPRRGGCAERTAGAGVVRFRAEAGRRYLAAGSRGHC